MGTYICLYVYVCMEIHIVVSCGFCGSRLLITHLPCPGMRQVWVDGCAAYGKGGNTARALGAELCSEIEEALESSSWLTRSVRHTLLVTSLCLQTKPTDDSVVVIVADPPPPLPPQLSQQHKTAARPSSRSRT